eukprot:TRINITY_DN56726_c0_g1_i1.p1 TRINITY_DN56726_c0_g1~~TRINITY_DN56726_c0_g1_i1.p1  ORF type:complete len:711 (+),score=95.84 TRINITY_DN56726_c0_g1_i1:69-2201(+)
MTASPHGLVVQILSLSSGSVRLSWLFDWEATPVEFRAQGLSEIFQVTRRSKTLKTHDVVRHSCGSSPIDLELPLGDCYLLEVRALLASPQVEGSNDKSAAVWESEPSMPVAADLRSLSASQTRSSPTKAYPNRSSFQAFLGEVQTKAALPRGPLPRPRESCTEPASMPRAFEKQRKTAVEATQSGEQTAARSPERSPARGTALAIETEPESLLTGAKDVDHQEETPDQTSPVNLQRLANIFSTLELNIRPGNTQSELQVDKCVHFDAEAVESGSPEDVADVLHTRSMQSHVNCTLVIPEKLGLSNAEESMAKVFEPSHESCTISEDRGLLPNADEPMGNENCMISVDRGLPDAEEPTVSVSEQLFAGEYVSQRIFDKCGILAVARCKGTCKVMRAQVAAYLHRRVNKDEPFSIDSCIQRSATFETHKFNHGLSEAPAGMEQEKMDGSVGGAELDEHQEPLEITAPTIRLAHISGMQRRHILTYPRGCFQSKIPARHEVVRDFGRIVCAPSHRIFVMSTAAPSWQPLRLGPSLKRALACSESERGQWVLPSLREGLQQHMNAQRGLVLDAAVLDTLCDNAACAMSAGIGVDFAVQVGLLPSFLQPLFMLLIFKHSDGQSFSARVVVSGFVAGKPKHVKGDRPDTKCTPWVACLASPDLLASSRSPGAQWDWDYAVREAQVELIRDAVESEQMILEEDLRSGSWVGLPNLTG